MRAMTTTAPRQASIPRGVLIAIAVLLVMTFIGAGLVRLGGTPSSVRDGVALTAVDLFFEDRDDGGVSVREAASGQEVEHVEPTTGGFMRAIVRSLVRDRRLLGIGPQVPFRLTRWDDGRLTLDDPATGRRVELVAFGSTNVTVFAQMLPTDARAPGSAAR